MEKKKDDAAQERQEGVTPAKEGLPKVKKIAELIERMTHEGVESCGCDGYEGHFGLLHAQNMGAVLRQTSLVPAEELFRDFWYKGTVSVLFGDNGIGKSVLAMQIAKTVAEAHPDELLVYLDTEMTRRQMKRRCHDAETGEDAAFPDNFLYVNPDWEGLDTIEGARTSNKKLETLFRESLQEVIDTGQKGLDVGYVVIDNLSSLLPDGVKAAVVTPFMTWLNQMKQSRGTSFLLLSHTPKVPDYEPLHKNHLSGSKRVSDAADVIVGMKRVWESKDVYLKTLKNRESEDTLLPGEVMRLRMARHGAMLSFDEVGVVKETECLPDFGASQTGHKGGQAGDRNRLIHEMSRQGMSERAIARALNISPSTVNTVKRQMLARSERAPDGNALFPDTGSAL